MTLTETISTMDSVSDLRALALSTLKPKRRKPAASAHIPTAPVFLARPLPPIPQLDAMQLDYGEDESASSRPASLPAKPDVQMLEEGEISDAESPPEAHPPPHHSSSQSDADSVQMLLQPSPPTPSPTNSAGLSLLDRIADAPEVLHPVSGPSLSLAERLKSPAATSVASNVINVDQVRPNLPCESSHRLPIRSTSRPFLQ